MIVRNARHAVLAAVLVAAAGCAEEPAGETLAGTGTAGGNPEATVSFALTGESDAAGVRWSGAELTAARVALGRRQQADCVFEPLQDLPDPIVFGGSAIDVGDVGGLCGLRLQSDRSTPLLRVAGTRDGREALLVALPDTVDVLLAGLDARADAAPVHLAVVLDVTRLLATIPLADIVADDGRLQVDDRDTRYGARLRVNTLAALSVRLDPTPADGVFSSTDLRDARRVGGVIVSATGEAER
jgi:hypothetical protein